MDNEDKSGEGLLIGDATPRTALLAVIQLQIAQTHILQLLKMEGGEGNADAAFEHVSKAVELLQPAVDAGVVIDNARGN